MRYTLNIPAGIASRPRRSYRGIILFEMLAYLCVAALLISLIYFALHSYSMALSQSTRREQQLERWTSISEQIRDDIRQARRLQWIPAPATKSSEAYRQSGPALLLTRIDGSVVQYCNFELHTELLPVPPAPPPAPPKKPQRNRPQVQPKAPITTPPATVTTRPLEPPPPKQMLVRHVAVPNQPAQRREDTNIVLKQVQIPKTGASNLWEMQNLEAGADLDASTRVLFLECQFELIQRDMPARAVTAAASTRMEPEVRP